MAPESLYFSSRRPLAVRRLHVFSLLRAWRLVASLLFVASLLLVASPSKAQSSPDLTAKDAPSRGTANVSPEVAQEAASIARQTMSPFCPGRTLSDCPSPNATEWRKDIRAMVASGMSAAEIQAELEKRAGGSLSGSPNSETSWTVPIFLAVAAGLTLFFVFARLRPRRKKEGGGTNREEKAAKSAKASTALPSVDDARLQRELESDEV